VVVIADACRAGEKNDFGRELFDLAKKSNIAVLLGCQPGTKSYESPQLRSGIYTYFLLRALGNPKNRTESGGLWTSRLAASIESSVYEYTKHDYGDNAQRPTAFADPTSDVMLAKFIDKSLASDGKDADLAMTLDREKNAEELIVTAESKLGANDYPGALEAAKQALALKPEKLQSAYYAALATEYMGRSGEHQKFCNLMTNSIDPYFKNFGMFISNSRATPIEARLKAMEAYWQASPKDDIYAIQVWARARTFATLAETKRVILSILPGLTSKGRVRAFFEGEIANADGNLDLAIAKYREARKFDEGQDLIGNDMLVLLEMTTLFIQHKYPEVKALLKVQFNSEKVSPMIWTSGAAYLKLMGNRDAAIAIIKKGIKEGILPEDDVVLIAVAMGASLPDISEDLDAQVKLQPYSWKVRTVATFAHGMKDKDAHATALAIEDANHYCDDELEIATLAYRINDAILADSVAQGVQSSVSPTDIRETYRLLFLSFVDRLGTDSEKWQILGTLGLSSMQGPNTYHLFKKYIKDFNAKASQGADFYEMLFQLAASDEDDEMVKFAVLQPSILEPDRSEYRLNYVAYLLSRRNYASAKEALKEVKQVSDDAKQLRAAIDAIFLARSGDKSALVKLMKSEFGPEEYAQIGRGITAICLADLGMGDLALPHLEAVSKYNLKTIPNIRFRCVEAEMKVLKTANKVAQADSIFFDILASDQNCPAITASFFGTKPDISNYVGEFKSDTKWFSDDLFEESNPTHKDQLNMAAIGQGTIVLKVNSDGNASGSISIVGGDTFVITAKVDALGNLRGEVKSDKHTLIVEAKLLSNDFKRTETFKKSNVGQIVVFTDERGIQTRWLIPNSRIKP
ncbi:MAG: hypothetical protein WCG75_05650, partial [Armatimonadota bacterium]